MKLKGQKKIKNVIKNFLSENGLGDFKIILDTDFAYIHSYDLEEEPHKICFSLVVPDDNGFTENFYRRYKPQFLCDIALISLFHEVGHNMTWNDFTEEEHDYFHEQKEWIDYQLTIETKECYSVVRDLYFGVADEDAATRWAIDYIENNAEKVAKFWTDLQSAIYEFYVKNGVDF